MANKTILILLFFIIFQNFAFGQSDTLKAFRMLERKVDSVVSFAIRQEAFPGCVVYASQAGKTLLFKAYGHHTYDQERKVLTPDIYDLASVTKVSAATLALMKLYEQGRLDLDAPLKDYVKGLRFNKKANITIRECLSHQSGLKSWIKYYEEIRRKGGKYKRKTLSSRYSEKYPFKVGETMYLHRDFYQQIKKMIRKSSFSESRKMVYSDLFFYLVPEIVENLSGLGYQEFLTTHFYELMGAGTIGYSPLDRFPAEQVVPTEIDSFFRNQIIHGTVHDEGAILMKGVSGNAGLFSNAEDLAKVWQMYLNGGSYEGIRYLHPATLNLFTSYQYPSNENRRALGFDKPLLTYDLQISSIAESASIQSFGHTGYTGTLVWADPVYDFLFIFLTNRVYPGRDYRAIYAYNIRPTIHALFYEFLKGEIMEIQKK